jgi:hypothetical protein
MIGAAIAAVRNWFVQEEQTVETILKGWFSAVVTLEAHAQVKAEEVLFHNAIAIKAGEFADAASREATKAKVAAEKIKAVLS